MLSSALSGKAFPDGGRLSTTTDFAREGEFDRLSDTWLEALPEGLSPEEMLDTLRVLIERDEQDLARELLELSLTEMEAAGSNGISELCKGAAVLFDQSPPLRYALLEALRDEYLMFEPLEFFFSKSGLSKKTASIRDSWGSFLRLMRFRKKAYVLHQNFGPGQIVRVTRSSVTIDFEKTQDHDMTIEGMVETIEPLEENSLRIRKWKTPLDFESLPDTDPGEFLGSLFRESASDGSVDINSLRPYLKGASLKPASVWRKLREFARSSSEYTEMGDRIVLRSGSSLEAQIRAVLADRKSALSKKSQMIASILKQKGSFPFDSLSVLISEIAGIDDCETGARFELVWLLSSRSKSAGDLPDTVRLVETVASRASRALGEIHSSSCRKAYIKAFLEHSTDRKEVFRLMCELPRPLWFTMADEILLKAPDLLSICITLFLNDRTSVNQFMWTLEFLTTREVKGDFPDKSELLSLLMQNLCFAKADTQRRVAGLLQQELRPELERFVKETDRRNLDGLVSELDGSSSLHETGLMLLLKRELSGRKKGSATGRRCFWESDALFDSRKAIERRRQEIDLLLGVRIPAAADAIAEAASHGDLSENAEYTAAIERRDLLLDTLRRWRKEFEKLRPYPETEVSSTVVSPGTRVVLAAIDDYDDVQSFSIVGPLEADPASGRINYLAPLGSALLGREIGDSVNLPGSISGRDWRVDDIEILKEVLEQ